jgi:hypothetical protein
LTLGRVARRLTRRQIANGVSTVDQGAADRTLVVIRNVEDLEKVVVGDFLLIEPEAARIIRDRLNQKTPDVNIQKIMELSGGLLLVKQSGVIDSVGLAQQLKKPALLLTSEAMKAVSKHDLQIVTVDFAKGDIYSGRLGIKERVPSDPDTIADRLKAKIQNRDLSFMPISRYDAGQSILRLNIHPRLLVSVLEDIHAGRDIKPEFRGPVVSFMRSMVNATGTDESATIVQRLFNRYKTADAVAAHLFEEYFYREFSEFARGTEGAKTAVFQMDNLRSNQYGTLLDGDQYESEEANPTLGVKGALRYLKPEYQGLFLAQINAARRVRSDGLDAAFMVVEANVPELSAETRRLFEQSVPDKSLPLGLMVMTPSQVIGLDEQVGVGNYSFVYLDRSELPYDIQLADAGNPILRARTSDEVLKAMRDPAERIMRASVLQVNKSREKGQERVQIAVEANGVATGDDASHSGSSLSGRRNLVREVASVVGEVSRLTAVGLLLRNFVSILENLATFGFGLTWLGLATDLPSSSVFAMHFQTNSIIPAATLPKDPSQIDFSA